MIPILHTLIICLCVIVSIGVVALGSLALMREDKDRPLLPWGKRMEVERNRALTEIRKEQLAQDAIEIKRITLDHHRTEVLKAIEAGEDVREITRLALEETETQTSRGDY